MDISNKRFRDLEELIKIRKEFNAWIREDKLAIEKDDESEIYSQLKPINIRFKVKSNVNTSIKPNPIIVEKYGRIFNGLSINKISFFYYDINNEIIINSEKSAEYHFPLTDGLKLLLEGRGLLKLAAKIATQEDLQNYFKILQLSNVEIDNIDYLITLENGGLGKGKDGKGFDLEDDYTDIELNENPINLFQELRKLLAAKMAGHNNVYNSVVSILKKLLKMKQISEEKYNKILKKYF